jgi:hypothetical protein
MDVSFVSAVSLAESGKPGKDVCVLERFGHPEVQIIVVVSPVPIPATFSNRDIVL